MVRGILKIVEIQAKLFHLRHEIFSKLYRHLVTELYTLLPLDIV